MTAPASGLFPGVWPLPAEDWARLNQQLEQLNAPQLSWLSGYLAGIAARTPLAQAVSVALPVPVQPATAAVTSVQQQTFTVLYASHTGNGKAIAQKLEAALREQARTEQTVRLINVRDYATRELKNEQILLAIVSTHGDGEPPDDAKALYEFLGSSKAPQLTGLRFAVLALGDSSYPKFCQFGHDVHQRLSALGAQALQAVLESDIGDHESAKQFQQFALGKLSSTSAEASTPSGITSAQSRLAITEYSKENLWHARVLSNQRLTSDDADKNVRHIELSLAGSAIRYTPGDALGVQVENSAELVERVLKTLQWRADEKITRQSESLTASEWLTKKLELTQIAVPGLKRFAQVLNNAALNVALEGDLRAFLRQHQWLDIWQQYGIPSSVDAAQILDFLRPLTPRLYSIASSQNETDDEVHLTVALNAYDAFGFRHFGAGSGALAAAAEASEVSVFVQENDNFRLPKNSDVPIIMIGAGTGVAPFRAFMQERVAVGAKGGNHLFFGEQHRRKTFLYQREWLDYLKRGQLHRLELAFSRESTPYFSAPKEYVQQSLLSHAKTVYALLQEGAHVYVCGDANGMARDVDAALKIIVKQQGALSSEHAEQYWQTLTTTQRYQRDVY